MNYLHPEDTAYWYSGNSLCSPAIVKLDSGRLLVSMDIYRPRYGQNLTKIFFSDDGGESWSFLTDLFPCFWGKLFVHRNALYMLAMTTEYGDVLVGRSEDGGRTWPRFVNLFPGSGNRDCGGPHKAPMNIFSHNGRLWTAVDYGTWERGGHATGVLSVGEDDDLLDPASWTLTPFLPFDDNWPGAARGKSRGCLEGNMVLLPDGKLVNFLRYRFRCAHQTMIRRRCLRWIRSIRRRRSPYIKSLILSAASQNSPSAGMRRAGIISHWLTGWRIPACDEPGCAVADKIARRRALGAGC